MTGRRAFWAYAAPSLALLVVALWPVVGGRRTFYLRDVLNTHLPMKASEAEALRQGTLPLVDPYRAGGQPLLGNPNAVPLYPDNVLYLVASPLSALNAHLWIHLLVAPFAMAWLARAWGLGRPASWCAGVIYGTSGFLVSNASFYNLIGGTSLAPALVAAALVAARDPARRWPVCAAGLLWCLLLLAGDPLTALLALLLAAGAIVVRGGTERRRLLRLAAALGCGTLLAAPQIVEFARIVPLSFRGAFGFSAAAASIASLDPRQLAGWLLPFFFGRPDLLGSGRFWGAAFFTGFPPYYLTLYPGLLLYGLAAASGRRPGRAGAWAWGAVLAGAALALGRFDPLLAWLFDLGVARVLRYPVKFWLPAAVGIALLAGLGFERSLVARERPARRRLAAGLALLAVVFAAAWLWFGLGGSAFAWARRVVPAEYPAAFVRNELLRWAGLSLLSLLLLAGYAALLLLARRRPVSGAALLLALHAAAQLFLLHPALATDEAAFYRRRPELADRLPPGDLLVHGAFRNLFGPNRLLAATYPDGRALWIERQAFDQLYPFAGALWGFRYDLNVSAEGLDSFFSRLAASAVEATADDGDRIRLLAAWGIDTLLLDRPLDAAARPLVEERLRQTSFGEPVFAYRIRGAAPAVAVVGDVTRAAHVNAALDRLRSPAFRPCCEVVLPGAGNGATGRPGRVLSSRFGREEMSAEVAAPGPSMVVFARAYLPIYRAEVDGEAARVEVADLARLAVAVPTGRHTVRVRADRRPLHLSLAAAALGLLGILGLARAKPGGPGDEGDPAPAPSEGMVGDPG